MKIRDRDSVSQTVKDEDLRPCREPGGGHRARPLEVREVCSRVPGWEVWTTPLPDEQAEAPAPGRKT